MSSKLQSRTELKTKRYTEQVVGSIKSVSKSPELSKKLWEKMLDVNNKSFGYYVARENLPEPTSVLSDGTECWFTGWVEETLPEILEKQKAALTIWFEFFKEHEKRIPDQVKYLLLREMLERGALNLGENDNDIPVFTKRNPGTLAPVYSPRENEEALFQALDEIKNKKLDFEQFPDIYAKKIKHSVLENKKRLEEDEKFKMNIKWRIYENAKNLHDYLQGKNTGWCLATGSAKSYVNDKGRIHVGYYLNAKGEEVPAIAVAENLGAGTNKIREVRGRENMQNLHTDYYKIYNQYAKDEMGVKDDKTLEKLGILQKLRALVIKLKEKHELTREEFELFCGQRNSCDSANFGYELTPELEKILQVLRVRARDKVFAAEYFLKFYKIPEGELCFSEDLVSASTRVFFDGNIFRLKWKTPDSIVLNNIALTNSIFQKSQLDPVAKLTKQEACFLWRMDKAKPNDTVNMGTKLAAAIQKRNQVADAVDLFLGPDVTVQDLKILYQKTHDQPQYFGQEAFEFVMKKRNSKSDLALIYNCKVSEVALSDKEINRSTVVAGFFPFGLYNLKSRGDYSGAFADQVRLNELVSKMQSMDRTTNLSQDDLEFLYDVKKAKKSVSRYMSHDRQLFLPEGIDSYRDVERDIHKLNPDWNNPKIPFLSDSGAFFETIGKLKSNESMTGEELQLLYGVVGLFGKEDPPYFQNTVGEYCDRYPWLRPLANYILQLIQKRDIRTDFAKIFEVQDFRQLSDDIANVTKRTVYFTGAYSGRTISNYGETVTIKELKNINFDDRDQYSTKYVGAPKKLRYTFNMSSHLEKEKVRSVFEYCFQKHYANIPGFNYSGRKEEKEVLSIGQRITRRLRRTFLSD